MITSNIEVTTAEGANRAISRFMRTVEQRSNDLVLALAEEMQAETQAAYDAQSADGNSCSVSVTSSDDGTSSVVASGRDVMFLEFGAGYGTDEGHEWAGQVGDVYPGSWSESHSRQFSRTGHWTYRGHRYTGIQATRGLLNAFDDVSGRVEEIADRVFV